MLSSLTRNWWTFLLQGLFAIIFGVLVLVQPATALIALVYLFAAGLKGKATPIELHPQPHPPLSIELPKADLLTCPEVEPTFYHGEHQCAPA